MAGPLGDAHRGGAHRAERLVRGVHQQGMGVDAARRFEFHQVRFEQDVASPHVAQVLRQQAAHGVVDGLVVGGRLDDGYPRRRNRPRLHAAPGHHGGARGGGQQFASGELLCHRHTQKISPPFCVPATSMSSDVSGSVRQAGCAGGQYPSGRRPWASSPMRSQFSASADRHSLRKRSATPNASLGLAGAHPAQGRQRHAGGLRVRRRFIAQRAHRSVIPAAARGTCAAAGTGGLHRPAAGSPPTAGGPSPFPAPEWPATSVPPTPPSRGSTAIPEIPARALALCPAATCAYGTSHVDSSPVVPNSQSMARACIALPSCSGEAAPPAQSPTYFRRIRFAEASLRPATAWLAARQARAAPAPLRPRPAEPGWRRPSAPSRRFRGRTANRHPDSVCSPQVRSTSRHRGWRRRPHCPLYASYPHLENQRTIRRLRRRESSMTSVTPAPSQIAPCIANSISFLLSW